MVRKSGRAALILSQAQEAMLKGLSWIVVVFRWNKFDFGAA